VESLAASKFSNVDEALCFPSKVFMSRYTVSLHVYCYVLQILCGKSDSCCTCARSNTFSKQIDSRKLVLSIYVFLCDERILVLALKYMRCFDVL
jgi:hypothetical protein